MKYMWFGAVMSIEIQSHHIVGTINSSKIENKWDRNDMYIQGNIGSNGLKLKRSSQTCPLNPVIVLKTMALEILPEL